MNKKVKVVNELLRWYDTNGRQFLWRSKGISIYKLLACEIFLWRTQASRVSQFIELFFKKYPSPKCIEQVPLKELAEDIKKLGLSNRRAKKLKNTFSKYGTTRLPKSEKEFRKIFKLGQYTARSVLAIRYNKNAFPVDQNIRRFFERVFNYKIENIRNISKSDNVFLKKFFRSCNEKIIWAVIDFASLVCKNRYPSCSECILKKFCHHYLKISK